MSDKSLFSAFLRALVAAVNPFAGGNSRLARSLRARAQPRDKKGRWVETGQGFSFNLRLPSGRVVDVATRSFGAGASENTVQVYFPDGDAEIPAGFYEVPSTVGDASKGFIPGQSSYLEKPNTTIKDVVDISSLQRKDAPDGWKLNDDGSYETLDGEFKIARNAGRTGWTLSNADGEIKTEQELSLAFKEAARRDVENASTNKSREAIARLKDSVEQVRLREGVSEADVEQAQRELDRVLFDDPDLEQDARVELVDTAPRNPESLGKSVQVRDSDRNAVKASAYTGQYYDAEANTFSEERQALHDQVIEDLLRESGATPVADPTQYMKGGGPGAGKSSLTGEMTNYDPNHIVIDPDEIKLRFPEVRGALGRLAAGDANEDDMKWASESHEESSYLAKRLHRAAVERNLNVVVDGTGDSGIDSIREKVDEARSNGYKNVVADYLYLEPEEGIRRAELRQEETFRKVPTEVIARTYQKIPEIFPQLLEENLFDSIRVYDNNVEREQEPKLVFEAKSGEIVSRDDEGYNAFLDSAGRAYQIIQDINDARFSQMRSDLASDFELELSENDRAFFGRMLNRDMGRRGPLAPPLPPREREILDEYRASLPEGIAAPQDEPPARRPQAIVPETTSEEQAPVGEAPALSEKERAEALESADAIEKLYPELTTRESEIDVNSLDERSRKALRNLTLFKQNAYNSMRRASFDVGVDGAEERFELAYAIASRVASSINELVDASKAGNSALVSFFSGAEEARIENMRIIPSSVETTVATDDKLPEGQRVISEAEAIIITKTGKPMLVRWINGSGISVYPVRDDGSVSSTRAGYINMQSNIASRGTDSHGTAHEPDKPVPVSVGMIEVEGSQRNEGLGGYLIMMARWAAQKSGRIFEHSHHLLRPGNFYSKLVSNRIEFHHRAQREKFVFERYGRMNLPLFKALDTLGWLEDSSLARPGNPNKFKNPLRLETQDSFSNEGALYKQFDSLMFGDYSSGRNSIARLVREYFKGKDAIPGEDYPAFFEKHVTGPRHDWSEFDVQTMLLRMTFKGGPTKEEVVPKLRSMAEEMTKFADSGLFNGDLIIPADYDKDIMRSRVLSYARNLTSVADAIEATDFAEDSRFEEAKYFDENEVKFFNSPFSGDFVDFKVPEGVTPVEVGPDFRERVYNGLPQAVAEGGTNALWARSESPSHLADEFTYEELVEALRTAIVGNKDGSKVALTKNDFTSEVQGGAVYRAIQNMGYNAEELLASLYDEVSENDDNQKALAKYRSSIRNLRGDIDALQNELSGDLAKPTAFDVLQGDYSEDSGLLFSDPVRRRDIVDEKSLPSEKRLSPLSENNIDFSYLAESGQYTTISRRQHSSSRDAFDWQANGISDNPRIIARNFSTEGLRNALSSAVARGKVKVRLRYPNNKDIDVPLEALRDALQYQGLDTNELFRSSRFASFRIRDRVSTERISSDTLEGGRAQNEVYNINNPDGPLSVFVRRPRSYIDAGEQIPDNERMAVLSIDTRDGAKNTFGEIVHFLDEEGNSRFRVRYVHPSEASGGNLEGNASSSEAVFDNSSDAFSSLTSTVISDLYLSDYSLAPMRNMFSRFSSGNSSLVTVQETAVQDNVDASGDEPIRERVLALGELQRRTVVQRDFSDGRVDFVTRNIEASGDTFSSSIASVFPSAIEIDGATRDVFVATASGGQKKYFDTKEEALTSVGWSLSELLRTNNNVYDTNQPLKNNPSSETAPPAPEARFERESFTSSREGVRGSGAIILGNGQVGQFSSSLNTGTRPRYRTGDSDPFRYASFEVSVDGATSHVGKVYRSGQSRWTVLVQRGDGRPEFTRSFSPISAQDDALSLLKREMVGRFGISSSDIERMFPAGEPVQPVARDEQPVSSPTDTPVAPSVGLGAFTPGISLPADGELADRPNSVLLRGDSEGADEADMIYRAQVGASRISDESFVFPAEWINSTATEEVVQNLNAAGFADVIADGNFVQFRMPGEASPALRVRVNPVPGDTSSSVERRTLAHQIYNVLGFRASTGGQLRAPSGALVSVDIAEIAPEEDIEARPLNRDNGNATDMGAPLEPLSWMNMSQSSPGLAQAREDLQRSRVVQMLLGDVDLFDNPDRHRLIMEQDGTYRVAMVDGQGAFAGIFNGSSPDVGSYISQLYSKDFNEAVLNKDFTRLTAEQFGNVTPRELRDLVTRYILPFTPEAIRATVRANIDNMPASVVLSEALIDRRRQMLSLFGIEDPEATQAVEKIREINERVEREVELAPIKTPVYDEREGIVLITDNEYTAPNGNRFASAYFETETGPRGEVYDQDGRVLARVGFVADLGDVRIQLSPGDVGNMVFNGNAQDIIIPVSEENSDEEMLRKFNLAMESASSYLYGRRYLGNVDSSQYKNLFDTSTENYDDLPLFEGTASEYTSFGPIPMGGAQLNPVNDAEREFLQNALNEAEVTDERREFFQGIIDSFELNAGYASYLHGKISALPRRGVPAPETGPVQVNTDEETDLLDVREVSETRPVRVSDLKPGDVVPNNGEVIFVTPSESEGSLDVHLIDPNGMAKLWRVNSDGVVPVLNAPPSKEVADDANFVVAFRNEGNQTLDDLKARFPDHTVLPNGDVLLHQRIFTEASRQQRTFQFEIVVHRTETEEFVAYARRFQIDPSTGEKIGPSESAALSPRTHSSRHLINQSKVLIEKLDSLRNPASWFSNKSPESEIIDPRTGLPLPASLVPSRVENEIPGTGIDKTGDGLKDSLISYIMSLLERGLSVESIMQKLSLYRDSNGNPLFSDEQLLDILDRIQFHRRFPLEPEPYVSRDGQTVIQVGDRVDHYDAFGRLLKSGVVTKRLGLIRYRKPNGDYEYRDSLEVRFDGSRRAYPIVARRLQISSQSGAPVPSEAPEELSVDTEEPIELAIEEETLEADTIVSEEANSESYKFVLYTGSHDETWEIKKEKELKDDAEES